MKSAYTFLAICYSAALLLTLTGCKKEEDDCGADKPGDLTLVIKLQHHEHPVVNLKNYRDTVYVKFNSLEFPGINPFLYNGIYIGDYPGETITIPNLNCGEYFIYATGYESVHSYRVSGGIPFSTKQKSGEVTITVPVTE